MKKPILAAALAACMQQACAVDIKAGDWNVAVGGIINAYYTGVSCGGDEVGGLALGGKAIGCGGEDRRTTVGNGLGLSWGRSANDDDTAGAAGLKSNANLTAGAYYTLNSVITLVAEVGQTRSRGFAGNTARLNGGSMGGIIFF